MFTLNYASFLSACTKEAQSGRGNREQHQRQQSVPASVRSSSGEREDQGYDGRREAAHHRPHRARQQSTRALA